MKINGEKIIRFCGHSSDPSVYSGRGATLAVIPIRAIDLRHGEFSGDAPEPVIILGGTKVGKCSSLNLIDIEDIEIQPDIAKWPE